MMKPRSSIRSVGSTIALALLSVAAARAGYPVDPDAKSEPAPSDAPWMQPLVGTGFKTNDNYTDGNIFFTAPLWSTLGRNGTLGGDYLFLEPYTSLGEERQIATSMGLSWRHLFSNEPRSALQKQGIAGFLEEGWFVGGNIFGDMLDTQSHNSFWQMGFGGEVGTRYLEFDGNYYCPLTGEKQAGSDTSTQTFTGSSTSTQTTFGVPFATGNSIMQPMTTTATTTTATTTARTLTSIYEEGMRGWDAQAVVLVPWVDQWTDFRINGGYLRFDNQPLGPQGGPTGPVHGWKAGAELRPVPAVVLGGEWYEDERFAGANWVVSLEFQIPLDRDWMDAFKPRRRHLVEHLAEPVHRQNDAIKIGNNTTQQTTMTVARSSTQTTVTAQQLLKADIVFVNSGGVVGNGIGAGNGSGTGTAQNPFNTIQAGANLAGANSTGSGSLWTTYVQGGGPTYNETVYTTGSTYYLGSSQPIQGFGGKYFGGGPNPVLNGSIVADATKNPNIKTVGIQGFTIQNGDSVNELAPIAITDVKTITITNNYIVNSLEDGIDITVDNTLGALSSTALIANNTIVNPAFAGINLLASNGGASLTAIVRNNIIAGAQADAIDVEASSTGGAGPQIQATITGNTLTSPAGYGVYIESDSDGTSITAIVNNNVITNTGLYGVGANSFNASTLTLSVSNNTVTNAVVGFDITSFDNSTLNFTATGNQITASHQGGILLNVGDSSFMNANLVGNTIASSRGDGIDVTANNSTAGTGLTLSMTGNTISTAASRDALSFNISNSAAVTATVSENTLTTGASGYDVRVQSTSTSPLSLTVSGNTMVTGTGTNGYGVYVDAESSSAPLSLTVSGNTISGGLYGAALTAFGPSTINVSGNTISQNSQAGIAVASESAGNINLFINQNTLSSTGVGIYLVKAGGPITVNPATTLINNTVTGDAQWMTNTGAPTGSILINGTTYTLPTNAP